MQHHQLPHLPDQQPLHHLPDRLQLSEWIVRPLQHRQLPLVLLRQRLRLLLRKLRAGEWKHHLPGVPEPLRDLQLQQRLPDLPLPLQHQPQQQRTVLLLRGLPMHQLQLPSGQLLHCLHFWLRRLWRLMHHLVPAAVVLFLLEN